MRRILAVGVVISVLGSLGFGQKKSLPIPVPLNHFYIVVDSATYKAIAGSEFLRNRFAVSELRTTVRTDWSYTAVYFYGANTYFEFFDAGSGAVGPEGSGGIALGVDRAGGLDILKSELASDFEVRPAPITRLYEKKQVPWFYMAVPKNYRAPSSLGLFLVEYHPGFLSGWNPEPGGANQGVSRSEILQRYKRVLKSGDPASRLLDDVVALEIAVDEPTGNRLGELCQALGYRLLKEGGMTVLEGPQITLRLVPATDLARGIREIRMRVRPAARTGGEFHFGPKSTLKFHDDGIATWSFR